MSVADKKRLITELMQRLVSQELKLPVEAIFPFAEIEQAVKRSLSSGKQGKVLLRP
jgi:NADPH:quinone reductase-like Zn-dependent oxidoreductase